MAQRIPWLRELPRLSLPPAAIRLPHLRKQLREDGMSTLEAIYRATALLEGEERAAPLARLMERAVLHHSVRAL